MKKFFHICLLLLSFFVSFSCSNLLSDNRGYGGLTLKLSSSGTVRAAENIDSLEYTVSVINRDTNAEISQKGGAEQSFSFELESGFYDIKITAYKPSASKEILYKGETSNVKVVAGQTTTASVTLKLITNTEESPEGTTEGVPEESPEELPVTIKLELVDDVVKLTPSSESFLSSLIKNGCDGYYIGVVAGKNSDGSDNWICSKRILLTDDDALKNVDFKSELAEKRADIVKANGEYYAIITFYKNIASDENNREVLKQYKSEIYQKHMFIDNVAGGIQVTLNKYGTDAEWSNNSVTIKDDDEDLSITYFDNRIPDLSETAYSFLFPFATAGKKYSFAINPYVGYTETVIITAENSSEIQLQNLSSLKNFEVSYIEEADSRTVKINMNPLDIFSDIEKVEYVNLCVNAYNPDYEWIHNFQNIEALKNGISIMEDPDLWSKFKTKLQGYDKIIINPHIEFSMESLSGSTRTSSYMISLKSLKTTWADPNSTIVKFQTNGGSPIENITLPKDKRIYYYWYLHRWNLSGTENYGRTTYFVNDTADNYYDMIPVPTKEGMVFDGWYRDAACTEDVALLEYAIYDMASITLYAKWVEPCTINFVTNCDVNIPSITVASGRDYYFEVNGTSAHEMRIDGNNCIYRISDNQATYPKKAGQSITGWYTDEACTIPASEVSRKFNATANGEISLYAKWE